ncbi:hypothetical protein TGMAS_258090A [Toxoplasma gondii MAS]|uniref:Uncharacterized protein n=1 Tax=Toxoplasma gondii MAS TaxID=943118 RepID=A0A086QL79_TOXGO|nr:hypothetical protein TGMAS_258090A [Toxoplasma gondii MAS]
MFSRDFRLQPPSSVPPERFCLSFAARTRPERSTHSPQTPRSCETANSRGRESVTAADCTPELLLRWQRNSCYRVRVRTEVRVLARGLSRVLVAPRPPLLRGWEFRKN